MTTVEKISKARAHTQYKLADGTRVPGVTTVLGVLNKPFLVKWANNLGLEGIDSAKYVDALADIGTLAHYMIECDLRKVEPDLSVYSPEHIGKAENALLSWYALIKGKTLEPVLLEASLISEEHCYGGTIDFYGKIDGVLTLADIKTSKAIYPEHKTQAGGGYRQLLVENGYPVDDVRIFRVGRTEDEAYEDHGVTMLGEHWELFQHCLAVYRLQSKLRKANN